MHARLDVGGYRRSGLTVGVLDMGMPGLEGIDGFLASPRGVVRVATTPALAQRDPEVIVQKIIYDGLVGQAFCASSSSRSTRRTSG